jgi:hypothetical protein
MIDSRVSVVVDDFHVVGVTVDPSEADAPSIVDADAVPAFAQTLQGFEPIGRRNAQIIQHRGIRQHAQLAARHGLDWIAAGRRREGVPPQILSASLSAKFLITGKP